MSISQELTTFDTGNKAVPKDIVLTPPVSIHLHQLQIRQTLTVVLELNVPLSASIDSSDLLPSPKRAVITHSGNKHAHPSEIDNTILSNVLVCICCYNYVHTQTCTQHTSSHTIIVYVVIWMICM